MKNLATSKETARILDTMAGAISSNTPNLSQLAFVGIRSRGVPLAHRLAATVKGKKNSRFPVGVLDITLYRDDLSKLADHPIVKKTEIDFSLDGKIIYLVDDVLYTGRTIRCALDALFDLGRPSAIHLAVLVDRQGRELPIQADVVGMTIAAKNIEDVRVRLKETDGEDGISLVVGRIK